MAIEAVTFDFWNTLVVEDVGQLRDQRAGAWLGLLEGAGFAVERAALDAAMDSTWQEFQAAWTSNEQFTGARTAATALRHLGLEVPPELLDSLVLQLTESAGSATLRLTDGVGGAVRGLKAEGVRVGIICDVGLTPSPALRGHLARLDLLDAFDHWSFSDEVGTYKPDPVIYEHARAGLGGPPVDRCAHIGDLRRTDVAGALGAGWTAVRYSGVFDDTGEGLEADHVISSHDQLLAALGF